MNWKTIFCGAVLMIALNACSQTSTTTPPPQTLEPLTPTPVVSATPTLQVKRNDLIFVEFFGLT